MEPSARRSLGLPLVTKNKKAVAGLDVGDGLSHRNDTQPAINVGPNGLTSLGSAETQMTQAAPNSAPLPNLIYARAAESFETRNRVPHMERFLPKLCPPNRRALFFDDDNGTANVRFVRGMVSR
ncbi:hypothetical protein SAMN05444169_6085 [Bradyrhizobium erythrophlei]|jgi:hypothetical protein|uniref:Uncharacterized protein n=1 Tax=Bradyrhizobium erythrophlei TaxID=1437360 RepID=A0A1M5QQ29_9BRAD|nr:hypothetical protein SAMN05444169_6085 [Bradyrhizobium erythrophlei]